MYGAWTGLLKMGVEEGAGTFPISFFLGLSLLNLEVTLKSYHTL